MELIEIIYSIMMIVGSALILIIISSYIFMKKDKHRYQQAAQHPTANFIQSQIPGPVYQNKPSPIDVNVEETKPRINKGASLPLIFYLNQEKQREVKIVRQPTSKEINDRSKIDQDENRKTSGNGSRYTIVNENKRKEKQSVAHFYL